MFEYVEIAVGGTKNRKQIVKLNEVKDLTANQKDAFVSYFIYDEEAIAHFQKNTTMRLFRGRCFSPALAFDIDADNIEDACKMTLQLYDDLERNWELNRYYLKTSFSGKKGFHVILNSFLFGGFSPQENLPQKLASLASLLTDVKYDKSTYGHIKLFRAYGSIHGKTNLYKIQVDPDDLEKPDFILEKAKSYIESWSVPAPDSPISKLVRLKEYAFGLVPEVTIFGEIAPKQKLCIIKMLEGINKGERHDALARLAAHFKEIGLTAEMAWASILEWNKKNEEKEIDEGFKETFKSIWQGPYKFGCYDYLLDSYCNKRCYLYPKKKGKVKDEEEESLIIKPFSEARKEYEQLIEDDRGIKLGFSSVLDQKIRGHFPGQLGVIVGRPGTYKSTLAQTICDYYINHYDGFALYVSLEMSLSMIYERQMQIVMNMNPIEISKSYKNFKSSDNYKRFLVSDKTNLTPHKVKDNIEAFQDKTGGKVELLVLDYLHALKERGSSDRERVENAMRACEEITKELSTRTLVCVHTSREGGGDSYQPLDNRAGRSASAIEDVAYFFYGLHLIKDDESALCVQLLKNKNGPPWPHGVILDRSPDNVKVVERSFSSSFGTP